MKNKILTVMGIIVLACFATLGFFAFPVSIPLCGTIGLFYGIKSKNKAFIKWSSIALLIGVVLVVYTILLVHNM